MRYITLSLAAIGLATFLQPAFADSKFIGPGDCQPYGQTSDYTNMPIRADGIRNATTNSNKYVICPINRDQESNWISAGDALSAIVYFNYVGNGSISCTLTEGQDFSGLVPTNATTINAVPMVGSIRGASFNDIGVGGFSATITCRLPPSAKFLSIVMEEDGLTD